MLVRHVIVTRTSEAIDVTDSQPGVVSGAGDRAAAFRHLADEHLDAAYRLARAILRDPTEAQDATHDAIVRAWRQWSSFPTACGGSSSGRERM